MLKRWWGSAVVILVAVPGAVDWGEWVSSEPVGPSPDRVVTTEIGQQREMQLEDGSRIVLNTQTAVMTRESREQVEVELRSGEALFDSTKGSVKRVRVVAGMATVEGTEGSFSIRRTAEAECVVRVFSGEVTIHPDLSFMTVKLRGGKFATIGPRRLFVDELPPEMAARLLGWTHGKLIFDGDSLTDVASEFNRYNQEKILVTDNSLTAFRIGGSYNATDPVGFARALVSTFNIRAVSVRSGGRRASVIVLTKPRKLGTQESTIDQLM